MFEDETYDENEGKHLIGKFATYENQEIEVTDVKRRESGQWVTYQFNHVTAIPRRMCMPLDEFEDEFGFLFNDDN
jgi:hypothetical protein